MRDQADALARPLRESVDVAFRICAGACTTGNARSRRQIAIWQSPHLRPGALLMGAVPPPLKHRRSSCAACTSGKAATVCRGHARGFPSLGYDHVNPQSTARRTSCTESTVCNNDGPCLRGTKHQRSRVAPEWNRLAYFVATAMPGHSSIWTRARSL